MNLTILRTNVKKPIFKNCVILFSSAASVNLIRVSLMSSTNHPIWSSIYLHSFFIDLMTTIEKGFLFRSLSSPFSRRQKLEKATILDRPSSLATKTARPWLYWYSFQCSHLKEYVAAKNHKARWRIVWSICLRAWPLSQRSNYLQRGQLPLRI